MNIVASLFWHLFRRRPFQYKWVTRSVGGTVWIVWGVDLNSKCYVNTNHPIGFSGDHPDSYSRPGGYLWWSGCSPLYLVMGHLSEGIP
jgi:hypothetical protein